LRRIFVRIFTSEAASLVDRGLEGTWTEVMDASVEKFVEDVVFDASLVEALQSAQ
jgi:hypothetical protein